MNIGVIKEIRNQEHRVALTPAAVHTLVEKGHNVFVEDNAGLDSGFFNDSYRDEGAEIAYSRDEVYGRANIIVRVSPLSYEECECLNEEQIVFGFHHMAVLTGKIFSKLKEKRITAIGYEIIEENGYLPILTSMSEIAGQMSVIIGAHYLQSEEGGRGILFGGIPGVPHATVVVLGGGVVGTHAVQTAVGLGGQIVVLDSDVRQLRIINRRFGKQVTTAFANQYNIEKAVSFADILIGAILIKGERTPHIVTRNMVKKMKPRSVIIDVSIDQGGCVETSRPTTLSDPIYIEENVIHYCVPNMPSNVSRTATYALTNASFPYLMDIAESGLENAIKKNPSLGKGIYLYKGECTRKGIAEIFKVKCSDIYSLMK
ncbi:MAG: alanine dehydrogenase [Fidelibacterota bacterium]